MYKIIGMDQKNTGRSHPTNLSNGLRKAASARKPKSRPTAASGDR